ncbi:MAG: hypothetical protein AAGC72_01850 [Planctomycetota bacterium]
MLRVEGSSVILGQAASRPLAASTLIETVYANLQVRDHDAVYDLLMRYPDIAREALLDSDLARHPAAPSLAAWLDHHAAPARGGWSALVDDRKQNPERYVQYDQQRRSLWSAFRKGNFETKADLSASKLIDRPTPWPSIDATVLKATALLASGKPSDAAPLFESAAAQANDWDLDFADRQRLFAALSYRMAGRVRQAEEMEEQVKSLAPSRLADVKDPMILRLALKTMAKGPVHSEVEVASSRMILAQLGEIELQRNSPQAALLSFRAAESKLGMRPRTEQLRLRQAEALIALDQEQPAVVMLTGLAKGEARPEALALLGLIHLRRNEIESGMAMLQESVRLTTAATHPQIHADAGLALLSIGQGQEGLSLLRSARLSFRERGDLRAVRQSLQNELRYAESEGDSNLAQQVRNQLNGSYLAP